MPLPAQNLAPELARLRTELGDHVAVGDLIEAAEAVLRTLEGDITPADLRLHQEVTDLAHFIEEARRDIAAIRPDEIRDRLPAAKDELDAVVAATEAATSVFLGVAETITEVSEKVDEDVAEVLRQLATDIYEASSFQDITGQRISKVVKTMHQIEERVAGMVRLLEGSGIEPAPAPVVEENEDLKLLNGPQLAGVGNSQDDIDALLASFD